MFWIVALMAVISMGCGSVAVQHWRRAQVPWSEGLGMRIDRWTFFDLVIGFLISALVMVGIFAVGWLLGLLQPHGLYAPDANFWAEFLKRAVFAFEEEFIFRGLMLSGLALLFRRPWLALGVMAALFGLWRTPGIQALPCPPWLGMGWTGFCTVSPFCGADEYGYPLPCIGAGTLSRGR